VLWFACLQQFCVLAAASGFNLLSVLEGKVDADQQQRHKRPHGFALSGSNDSLHSAGKIKAAAPIQAAAAFTRSDYSPALACLVSPLDAAQSSELDPYRTHNTRLHAYKCMRLTALCTESPCCWR